MKKRLLWGVFLGLAIMLTGCSQSTQGTDENKISKTEDVNQTEEKETSAESDSEAIVLKVGLHNPENHPLCQGIKKFDEILDEKTNGRIRLEIYYGGQLGDKATHLQSLQTGALDMTMIMPGVLADYGATDLKVLTFPYLFDNVQHARAYLRSDSGKKLLDSIQTSGTLMTAVGTYQESARNYFFKDKKVTSVNDMKGLKIRGQEGSIYLEAIESLGASPVSVAFSELFSAMQTGLVDGAEQPLSGYVNNQFQEVSKYYLMDGHETSPNIVLMSEITWNSLTPEDQKTIKDCFAESNTYFEKLSDEKDKEYLQIIEDADAEIIYPDNPDEWRAAVQPVYDEYGEEYKEYIEAIKNTEY